MAGRTSRRLAPRCARCGLRHAARLGCWKNRAKRLVPLVLAVYGDTCHLCGQPGATTADHLIPRAFGGDDELDQLRPAHRLCNQRRGTMPLAKWFELYPIVRGYTPSRDW